MVRSVAVCVLVVSPLLFVPRGRSEEKAQQPTPEQQRLRALERGDGQALLTCFKRLTLSPGDQQNLGLLILQLDSPSFKDREKATTATLAYGPGALPLLRQALPGSTLERRMRLERCIKVLDSREW